MRDTANRYRKMRRKQYTAIFRHFTYTLIIIACDGNKLREKSQIHYSALGGVAEYCGESVCVSVYLCVCLYAREHISGNTGPSLPNDCACYQWPWLNLPLSALRYVMFFRFYGSVSYLHIMDHLEACPSTPLERMITPLLHHIDCIVWYGMVNVDLYSAIITKVSNALNTLVSVEKPGF